MGKWAHLEFYNHTHHLVDLMGKGACIESHVIISDSSVQVFRLFSLLFDLHGVSTAFNWFISRSMAARRRRGGYENAKYPWFF